MASPVQSVVVTAGDFVENVRFLYQDASTVFFGNKKEVPEGEEPQQPQQWDCPPGDLIVKIEARLSDCTDALQFVTLAGQRSPWFGKTTELVKGKSVEIERDPETFHVRRGYHIVGLTMLDQGGSGRKLVKIIDAPWVNQEKMEGARSRSSYRLGKIWDKIRDRQYRDSDRHKWEAPKASQRDPHHHHHHHDHHGHDHHGRGGSKSVPNLMAHMEEEDFLEGAAVVFEQRRKFKATKRKLSGKYDELEDNLFGTRRPPVLRTSGGEVVQSVFPRSSQMWVGAAPRFGSEVPSEKYVGFQADELSKWISVDKKVRLKSEQTIYDKPIRHYLKLDDTIDVHKMQGSHMRYFKNPLEDPEEAEAIERPDILGSMEQLRLQRRGSREGREDEDYDDEDYEYQYGAYDEEEGDEIWDPNEESQSETSQERAIRPDYLRRFENHLERMGPRIRSDMVNRMSRVEKDWRRGETSRPATLRFRR